MDSTNKPNNRRQWLTSIKADRDEWREILGANPTPETLAQLGIAPSTWARILAGKTPAVPVAAYRMASFMRWGHLADLLGGAWRDFYVSGDTLVFPGLKYPLQAQELRAAWLRIQDNARLRSRVRWLEEEAANSPGVDLAPILARMKSPAIAP